MLPQIQTLKEKKLIGKRLTMSLANDKTFELFRSFMPSKKEIKNPGGPGIFALRVYDKSYSFTDPDPTAMFEKWAAQEVTSTSEIPAGMESFLLPEGLYAVFHYKGSNTDTAIFRYIYGEWLPHSNYVLDERPHFELLGEKYRNNDPESEEEIWIPVLLKS